MTYGLNENDINMLISMADEDRDEQIDWNEFLDTGIRMIKLIYARNQAKQHVDHISHEALTMIYDEEIKMVNGLLFKQFRAYDAVKLGTIALSTFKKIIRKTRFLTPREKNLLIRLARSDSVTYTDFPSMLYNVRYEIACSELMETGISELE